MFLIGKYAKRPRLFLTWESLDFFKKLVICHAWARFSVKFDQEIDSCGYFYHKSDTFCNNGHTHF